MPASRTWCWRLVGTSPGRSSAPSTLRVSCCTGVAESGDVQPSAAEAPRWLARAEEDLLWRSFSCRPIHQCVGGVFSWSAGRGEGNQVAARGGGRRLPAQPRPRWAGRPPARGRAVTVRDDALVVLQPWATAGRYPEDIGEPDASTTTWIVELAPRWPRPLDRSASRRLSLGRPRPLWTPVLGRAMRASS
jgi:hypothetical protein